MDTDPTGFDRLVVGDVVPRAPGGIVTNTTCVELDPGEHLVPLTAAGLAAVLFANEGLRRENAELRAERDRWRRIAMDQADRLAAYARADVARDRVAPVKAWGDGGGV